MSTKRSECSTKIEPCPDCNGEGIIPAGETHYGCVECKGSGKIVREYLPPEAYQTMTDDEGECPFEKHPN